MRDSKLAIVVGLTLFGASSPAGAATLFGQVINQAGGLPVFGARLLLDRSPADDIPEREERTGASGAFELVDLEPGDYRLQVQHAAFAPFEQTVTVDAEAPTHERVELTPSGEVARFAVHLQAHCVVTNVGLWAAEADVRFWAREPSAADEPDAQFVVTANRDGLFLITGLEPGWYHFEIRKPGWEPLSWPSDAPAVELTEEHSGAAALEPVYETLQVQAMGVDPRSEFFNVAPLGGVTVELTGIDPISGREVMSTRAGFTHEGGAYAFDHLPPIHWEASFTKMGYEPVLRTAVPRQSGGYPTLSATLPFHDTRIVVEAQTPYLKGATPWRFHAVLEGIGGTPTDGIFRERWGEYPGGASSGREFAVNFEGLLPGQYWIRADYNYVSELVQPDDPQAEYFGSSYRLNADFFPQQLILDVADAETRRHRLSMEPVPAIVRGRVLVVDGLREGEGVGGASRADQIRRPLAVDDLRFVLHPRLGLLGPEHAERTVATDAEGFFELALPPGPYGIQMPELTEHTGLQVLLSGVGPDGPLRGPDGQPVQPFPWPYTDPWPHADHDRVYHGPPIGLRSSHVYHLDLVLAGHWVELQTPVDVSGPFETARHPAIFGGIAHSPFFELEPGPSMRVPEGTTLERGESRAWLVSRRLPAGTHTFELAHDLYDITANGPSSDRITVEIAPWAPPGAVPPLPPSDPRVLVAGHRYPPLEDGRNRLAFQAQWSTPVDTLEAEVHIWNDNPFNVEDFYEEPITRLADGLIELDALPGVYYSGRELPLGQATLWESVPNIGWVAYRGPQTVYVGGPENSYTADAPPGWTAEYELDLRTFMPGHGEVQGVVISENGVQLTSGTVGLTHVWITSAAVVEEPPGWQIDTVSHELSGVGAQLSARTELRLRRVMQVSGTVSQPGDRPAAGVEIRLENAGGVYLRSTRTDDEGAFRFNVNETQPVVLRIDSKGFYPVELARAPSVTDGNILDADIALVPLPPPRLISFEMTRFGMFLPGVHRSGNESLFDQSATREALRLTWLVGAAAEDISYEAARPPDPSGDPDAPASSESITVADQIEEVWVVDTRVFHRNPARPLEEGQQEEPPSDLELPEPYTWLDFEALQSRHRAGEDDEARPFFVHLSRANSRQSGVMTGHFQLEDLPPGSFDPVAIVVTRRGAVGVFPYERPEGRRPLIGVLMPTWASQLMNVIGAAASLPTHGQQLRTFIPKSVPLSPNGKMSGGISHSNGTLRYDYKLGVDFKQGMSMPTTGLASLVSNKLGVTAGGEVGLVFDGAKGEIQVTGTGSLGTSFAQSRKVGIPAIVRDRILSEILLEPIQAQGSAAVSVIDHIGAEGVRTGDLRFETVLRNRISAGVRFDLAPLITYLPYVGPAIRTSKFFTGTDCYMFLRASLGAQMTTTASTQVPRALGTAANIAAPGGFSFMSLDLEQRWDQLEVSTEGGLGISAAAGLLTAEGAIVLGGTRPGQPMQLTFNQESNWPPFTRVQGALRAELRLKYAYSGVKAGESWNFGQIPIDLQFGTEPYFDLRRTGHVVIHERASEAAPAAWTDEDGVLVNGFFSGGDYAMGPGFAYTQTHRSGMAIEVQSPGADAPTTAVQTTGVVTATTLVALPDDSGELLAWVEIEAERMGDPSAPSTIRYATRGAAGDWSEAQTAAALEGHALGLRATASGQQVLLAWMEARHAFAKDRRLSVAAWSAEEGFAAPAHFTSMLPGGAETGLAPISDFRIAGAPGEGPVDATILVRASTGELETVRWDGEDFADAEILGHSNAPGFDLICASTGEAWAIIPEQGSLKLWHRDTRWEELGAVAGARPDDAALLGFERDDEPPRLLVAWLEQRAQDELRWVFVDADAEPLEEAGAIPLVGRDASRLSLAALDSETLAARAVMLETARDHERIAEYQLRLGEDPVVAVDPTGPPPTPMPSMDPPTPPPSMEPPTPTATPSESARPTPVASASPTPGASATSSPDDGGGCACRAHGGSEKLADLLLFALLLVALRRRPDTARNDRRPQQRLLRARASTRTPTTVALGQEATGHRGRPRGRRQDSPRPGADASA